MPRHARIDASGAVHHLMIRGIAGSDIFYDDVDRDRFVERAGKVFAEEKTACYAFALLSNHVHFLLRTGRTSMAGVMRRLLTGYAVSFNKRHKRSGHLFQNRYKSILCEEDPYFLQLVRYIHLNPLRARMVENLDGLDSHPYSGHCAIMGLRERDWQDSDYVLRQFSDKPRQPACFIEHSLKKAFRKVAEIDLTGGGLIRSNKGWRPARGSDHLKGDERILGSSEFVLEVLKTAREAWEQSHALKIAGIDLAEAKRHVSRLFEMTPEDLLVPDKHPKCVRARSVLCYFLVRKLGMTTTAVAKELGEANRPSVSPRHEVERSSERGG